MTPISESLEKTAGIFRAAVRDAQGVICSPPDSFGILGWKMEAGASPYSDAMQGDERHGATYLTHMIGQRFSVEFAVWQRPGHALVCLKTGETGDDEPSWPMDTASAQKAVEWLTGRGLRPPAASAERGR